MYVLHKTTSELKYMNGLSAIVKAILLVWDCPTTCSQLAHCSCSREVQNVLCILMSVDVPEFIWNAVILMFIIACNKPIVGNSQ